MTTVTNTTPVDPGKPYADAQVDQQANKRAVLDAMASGGSAAAKAVQDAQGRISGDKTNAVNQALLESRQFNAPAEAQANVSAQIAAPYDLRNESLAQGAASRAQDFGVRSQGDETYFNKLDQLIPMYQDQAKTAYDKARARIDASNALQAQQMQYQADQAQRQFAADQANSQWQHQFSEQQFAAQQAQDQRDFDENVRQFGLDYALRVQAANQSARSGGGGGGGGGRSSGGGGSSAASGDYKQFGNTLAEQRSQLQSIISQGANQLNNSGSPQSANAAENLPHSQYVSQLIDQALNKPTGTTQALVPGAFKQPAPQSSAPSQFTYGEVLQGARAMIADGKAAGAGANDIINAVNSQPGWAGPAANQALREAGLYAGLLS